jgi:acyl carrier protein
MGLDTVEMVMETEETFGIKIADEEAERCITVGDFLACVLSHLPVGPRGRCLTAAGFYRLRRALTEALGVQRRDVRPKTRLADLLPWPKGRRAAWERVKKIAGVKIPELDRPKWVWNLIHLGVLPNLLLSVVVAGPALGPVWAFVIWLALMVPYYAIAVCLTRPLAQCFPARCVTVGDAARQVLMHNYTPFLRGQDAANWQDVWHTLRGIISEQLGIDEEKITLEKRFVQDLGC